MVKRLLPTVDKSTISCIRLSSKGEHAVFIDTNPTDCVKVCRVDNSQIISSCLLHTVPEVVHVFPALNVLVVIGKNRNLHILALRDCERNYNYRSKIERARSIMGTECTNDITNLEVGEKMRELMKENAKVQKMRNLNVDLGIIADVKVNGRQKKTAVDGKDKGDNANRSSSSCVVV